MPEGDTIYRTAAVLRRVLEGRPLTAFDTTVAQVAAMAARHGMVGRVVHEVVPRGKHLLIVFRDLQAGASADLVLHTHMRMTGSWHAYQPGVPWRKPARHAKVILRAEGVVAPCFSAPVVELLPASAMARRPALARLGPDAMAAGFDAGEVLGRLRARSDLSVAEGLLCQQALAGVGNVFKSEILFLERVNPFLRVADVPEPVLQGVVARARRLLVANRRPSLRQTRAALDPAGRHWVYGRSGRPCYECGTPIQMRRHGDDARSTYFCPRCQGAICGPAATDREPRDTDRRPATA